MAVLDTATNMVQLDYTFSGLTSAQTAAHIHQAAPGVNGPVIVPLPNGSPVSGLFALTPGQATAMAAGNTYVNVHTMMFPGGEIRGNLTKLFPVAVPMGGDQEVPPNASPATGSATVTLNPFTNQVILHMEFSGLSSAQTAAHFHLAPAGSNGPVIIPLPNGSPVDGVFTVTDDQEAALIAGNVYLNVHTTMFPGGEIRGQINPNVVVGFPMSGAQEVPPNDSPATGSGSASVNLLSRQMMFHYEFSGLTTAQTAAHIHLAPAGTNGPVIIPLPNGSPVDATFDLTPAQVDDFLVGNLYANVHTTMFPGGEIRGQLVNPPVITGACCLGVECAQMTSTGCADAGGRFVGENTPCDTPGVCDKPPPICPCDWNDDASVSSQDFFDFLTQFFDNNADFNTDGMTNSQDFFDFLTCFFDPPKGC
jgi:hypothetical protein